MSASDLTKAHKRFPTYQPDIHRQRSVGLEKGSRLVYGTSGLGGVWGKVDEEESIDCLLYAFERGVRSLDTSPSYSRSEEFVGKALQRWRGEQPFISTKVGRLPADKADECYVDYSPESMRQSLMRSLDRLGVEQLDLLFLHEPHLVPLDKINEILDTVQSFKAEGYTRMLGVGGNPPDAFFPFITSDHFQVVSSFLRLDACNLSALEKDIPHYQAHNIALYAASALHMGLLGDLFERYAEHPPHTQWISDKDVEVAKRINILARAQGMPLASLAQRYLFSMQEAHSVVIGASKLAQIQATLHDWQQGALSKELFELISQTILNTRNL
ncbi:aldo/keto reductase [Catalinimonas sp. 4WD22]|uniref:aldo/keto reductase n=1 Tax=Catalinimonas locisalis TaxID=3133978 RepID=UPI00310160EF